MNFSKEAFENIMSIFEKDTAKLCYFCRERQATIFDGYGRGWCDECLHYFITIYEGKSFDVNFIDVWERGLNET